MRARLLNNLHVNRGVQSALIDLGQSMQGLVRRQQSAAIRDGGTTITQT